MKWISRLLLPLVAALGIVAVAVPAGATTRPAWVGVHQTNNLAGWNAAQAAAGPGQIAREFFSGSLPATWSGAWASQVPQTTLVNVSYKTMDTNVAAFVASIPSTRTAPVWIIFHHEPEADYGTGGGPAYVSQFESQSVQIRAACALAGNCNVVKVGMIAGSYQYGKAGREGYTCAYIPPASYVDGYFLDAYQQYLAGLGNELYWTRWHTCLGTVPAGVVTGISEYGLGTFNANGSAASEAQRITVMQGDAAYLAANYPDLYEWMYWNYDDPTPGMQWSMTPGLVQTWQSIEAGSISS